MSDAEVPRARRTVRLLVEYDGTDFSGWQRQAGDRSVQAVLEDALSAHLGGRIVTVAAGRTDAGVHAAGQVVSFRTESRVPARGIVHGTNALLPPDVVILSADDAPPDFHACRDARAKHYRYRALDREIRSPLGERYAARVRGPLDVAAMDGAAAVLRGRHDFSSFRSAGSVVGDPVRELRELAVYRQGDGIVFDFRGDGFLYRMVRNIVGTLLQAGRGRLTPGQVEAVLAARDRRRAGPTAPACGLCLMEVFYG